MPPDDRTGLDWIHRCTAQHEAAHVVACAVLGLDGVEHVAVLDFNSPEAEERGLNGYVRRRRMKPEAMAGLVAATRGASTSMALLEVMCYAEVLFDLAGIAAECKTGRLDPDDVVEVEDGLNDEGSDIANASAVAGALGVGWEQALADAHDLLDSPGVWAAVEAVASRLLPPPNRLEFEDILAIPEVGRVFGNVGAQRVAAMLDARRGERAG